MRFPSDLLRSRILPAIVAALGVSFIAAGLLTYTTGTDADLFPFAGDGIAIASSDPGASVRPSASPGSSDSPVASNRTAPSSPPIAGASGSTTRSAAAPTATPKPKPTAVTRSSRARVGTRVVIPALDIDLPIVKPPGGSTTYPLCNVAMYIQNLSQPGYDGATYLYAHARVGMFLALLDQSKINNGSSMLGMLVQVYTSDNRYYIYEISEVRRHQLTLADAIKADDQELWLQTSEGPRGTPGKLQVIATPLSSGSADPADAHPTPHPVVCD